jgi:hypothetical protein
VDARRTDGARTSGGKAPIAAQCANTSSQLLALLRHAGGRLAGLLMGENRKQAAVGQNDANDP